MVMLQVSSSTSPTREGRPDTLVERLGAEEIEARDRAEAELRRFGERAEAPLRRAAAGSDLEIRTRAGRLLDRIAWNRSPPVLLNRPGVGSKEIWMIETESFKARKVLDAGSVVHAPWWSPDGKRFAYRRVLGWLIVHDLETGEEERITPLELAKDDDVFWSPDGKRILIISEEILKNDGTREDTPYARLYVVDVATKRTTLLTPEDRIHHYACWSPDGRQIAYVTFGLEGKDSFNLFDLFVIDAEGGKPRRLTWDLAPKYSIQWSPDGTKLAFDWEEPVRVEPSNPSSGSGGPCRIGVLDLRTGAARKIISGDLSTSRPQWSPDGAELLFVRDGREICIAREDGTGLRVVFAETRELMRPRWSPQGRRILFQQHQGETYRLSLINADGTGYRALLDTPDGASGASWAPLR